MCKQDVMNSQHAHCSLVGPDRSTRKVGPISVSQLACNEYSYMPFIAKSKAACGLCFHQLGGHVELPWLMCKYDVIHKTGSTQCIATPPEEDRAKTIGNTHKKFGKDQTCCISSDELMDRHTHTHRHGRHNAPLPYLEWSNKQ